MEGICEEGQGYFWGIIPNKRLNDDSNDNDNNNNNNNNNNLFDQ